MREEEKKIERGVEVGASRTKNESLMGRIRG